MNTPQEPLPPQHTRYLCGNCAQGWCTSEKRPTRKCEHCGQSIWFDQFDMVSALFRRALYGNLTGR